MGPIRVDFVTQGTFVMSEDHIILSGDHKGREARFLLVSSTNWLRMPLNILEFTDHSPIPLPKPEIIQLEMLIVPKWKTLL